MNNELKRVFSIIVIVAIIFSISLSPIASLETNAAGEVQMTDMAWDVLNIVNQERANNGLQPLTMDKGFLEAAQIRGVEIVTSFSHTRPDGSSCFTIFPTLNQTSRGENIAAGQRSASAVMNSWMNSPGHRANILDGSFNAIGIACVYVPNSTYGYYWVQCFGSTVNEGLYRGNVPTSPVTTNDGTIPMYRVYNPNSAEHFYTSDYNELVSIGNAGWQYEGVGWYAPASGDEVYRLYNPGVGDHHYTTSSVERDYLSNSGWNYEGVAWYSGGTVPLYRAYNPNAWAGAHHYTSDYNEYISIIANGWIAEDIAWYGVR